jgi:hypothetical protein
MKSYRVRLTKKQFNSFECHYPSNVVIVEVKQRKDIKTKSGISVGFNPDVNYSDSAGEDKSSHPADVANITGRIVKQVEKLYYNPKDINNSMSWETEIETEEEMVVWTHPLNAKNCCEIEVEDKLYQAWNYQDLFVGKKEIWLDKWKGTKQTVVVPLNGHVILQPVLEEKLSELDVLDPNVNKSRAIVKFNGSDNIRYMYKGVADLKGLKEGDTVLIEKGAYLF